MNQIAFCQQLTYSQTFSQSFAGLQLVLPGSLWSTPFNPPVDQSIPLLYSLDEVITAWKGFPRPGIAPVQISSPTLREAAAELENVVRQSWRDHESAYDLVGGLDIHV